MHIETSASPVVWGGFILIILLLLLFDIGLFHRRDEEFTFRKSLYLSVFWIALGLLFNLGVWAMYGQTAAMQFLTGYLVEKALSVDNIFVFIVLFKYFGVPRQLHHRVLYFGILGALIMRGVFIFLGAALLQNFHWIAYIFGVILIYTGVKLFRTDGVEVHPDENPVIRFVRRHFRVTSNYHGNNFFAVENGVKVATPLLLTLIAVETTDLVFAVDSIPAIFAITQDPFIVFTSNIFAILGLRALYFLLSAAMVNLPYLQRGLSFVLCFIGLKMLFSGFVHIPEGVSFLVILGILTASVVLSLRKMKVQPIEPPVEESPTAPL
jgi:tellurite resistance protein TerC